MLNKRHLHEAIILTPSDWEKFKNHFEQLHPDFYIRLHDLYPRLTPSELRLVTLIKLKFSTKKMAGTLGISPQSIIKTRYRLKKKLKLDKDKNLDSAIEEV
jgi:DNA-binding CsgD family transcriptional regulator